MKTLFVGDVHGCARELRRLLKRAKADRVILLGDLFTKGPDPVGVWEQIQAHGAESILGNHDAALIARWRRGGLKGPTRELARRHPEVLPWLRQLPLSLQGPGWIAVHAGVHPRKGLSGTSRQQQLTMRRWPDDQDPKNPFWYEAGWKGPERVIFGHDAARGLVRRRHKGREVALGLDSGCVYGKQLSGWILEKDKLIQVDAAEVYCPIR